MNKKYTLIPCFILGFLVGLAVMNLFHVHTLDRLYRVQNQLTNQLLDQEIKLSKLTEGNKNKHTTIVKELDLIIDLEGSPLLIESIEKELLFYLSDLIGKELSTIDGEMVYKILEGRIIEIDDRQIKLTPKYIIVEEKIKIGIKGKILDRP